MPPKKLILPDRIDQISAESAINELSKIKEYAKLIGWDITLSGLTWNSKNSFNLEIYGKRCRVPKIEMQQVKLPVKVNKTKQNKTKFKFKIRKD